MSPIKVGLIVLSACLGKIAFAHEGAVPSSTQISLSYFASSRGNYVVPGSDLAKVGNLGLVLGEDFGNSGKDHGIRPFGLELNAVIPLGGNSFLRPVLRLASTGMRLSPAAQTQAGLDGLLTFSYSWMSQFSESLRAGFDVGLRARRWQLERGPLPSSGHSGIVIASRLEGGCMDGFLEAGLMAFGLGQPESLGVQRDGSTLRAQFGYRPPPIANGRLRTWVEFFHTHRSFFGATVLTGENALFADEAALSIGFEYSLF